MSLPNLNELHKIDYLNQQLLELQTRVSHSKQTLSEVIEKNKQTLLSASENIFIKEMNKAYLGVFQQKTASLRQEESKVRQNLQTIINESLDKYFQSTAFSDFVHILVSKIQNDGGNVVVEASEDMSSLLHCQPNPSLEKNCLRIKTSTVEYILDRKVLQSKLFQHLIVSMLEVDSSHSN